MKMRIAGIFLTGCFLLSLTACKQEVEEAMETTLPAAIESTAAPVETTEAAEPAAAWLEDNVQGKVCVGFVPTEAGFWRYAVIEDQEAAAAAFEKATGAIYSDEWWIKGDRTLGLMVEYNGEIWDFVESGELVYALGRVKAEDAADLYQLCAEAARAAGWKATIAPHQLSGITSATLRAGGKEIVLTDSVALGKLEDMLTAGKYALGGTSCPFTVRLDVTLESGEILTIALAADSCGVWMSEGYYYEFGSDSQPLYDLFGVTMELGEIVE